MTRALIVDVDGVISPVHGHTAWGDDVVAGHVFGPVLVSPAMCARLDQIAASPNLLCGWLTSWSVEMRTAMNRSQDAPGRPCHPRRAQAPGAGGNVPRSKLGSTSIRTSTRCAGLTTIYVPPHEQQPSVAASLPVTSTPCCWPPAPRSVSPPSISTAWQRGWRTTPHAPTLHRIHSRRGPTRRARQTAVGAPQHGQQVSRDESRRPACGPSNRRSRGSQSRPGFRRSAPRSGRTG